MQILPWLGIRFWHTNVVHMYTKIKNLLAPFPFKPFSTLFWGLLPFSLRVPLHMLVRKGRRGKSSARTSFLTPFESNIKMGGEQHYLSFLVYFQVSICKLIFALVILHHVSFPSYPGINKVKKKKKIKIKEKAILLSVAFFWFLTHHIILISPGEFFSVRTKHSAFLVSHLSKTEKTWLGFPLAFSR